jgi:hypothetical protein
MAPATPISGWQMRIGLITLDRKQKPPDFSRIAQGVERV